MSDLSTPELARLDRPEHPASATAGLMSGYVWAVDPAVSKLAFAYASLADESISVETLPTACDAREGERLGLLDRQVRIFARQAADSFPPVCVWVEQASGRFQSPQLVYAIGVTQAAIYETLRCPVWSIPSGKWKRAAIGKGNATKEQIAAWVARRDTRPATQDEADAYAIAYAGREMFVQRRWEVAAA